MTHARLLLSLTLAATLLAGCDRESSTPADAAKAAVTPDAAPANVATPAAGVIQGTAKTQSGKPLPTFGGSISGYSLKSGQHIDANIDGKNGVYKTNVGPGQFASRAWTDVEYNGRKYRIDLDPADGKGGLVKQDTTDGVVKDWVWKLDGFRPGTDERSDDRHYGFYGGLVQLHGEGLGNLYQSNILEDRQPTTEPPLPKDSTIELTLTPDGPLIDGSAGQPVLFAVKLGAVKGYMERYKRGVPIGRYTASAVEISASGQRKPLRVVRYFASNQGKPVGPAASVSVDFIQSAPPSDNVNRVDELLLHAMY